MIARRRRMPWWAWGLVMTFPLWVGPYFIGMLILGIGGEVARWVCDMWGWEYPRLSRWVRARADTPPPFDREPRPTPPPPFVRG